MRKGEHSTNTFSLFYAEKILMVSVLHREQLSSLLIVIRENSSESAQLKLQRKPFYFPNR